MSEICFGTDGWRGLMAESFTVKNVQIVSQAIANYIKERGQASKGMVIGFDTRFFSEHFARAAASVLLGNAIPVYLIERPIPTPITAFAVLTQQAAGALMITASHNPPYYNGIKYISEYAGPSTAEITSRIEQEVKQVTQSQNVLTSPLGEKSLLSLDPLPKYREHLKKIIDFEALRQARLSVIIDPMYGACQEIAEVIFQETGAQVTLIHNHRDVLFGGSLPDPSKENLSELARLVRERKADLGLAFDGDGDRFGVVDSNGAYLSPNQALTLLSLHLIKTRPLKEGVIVRSITTTHLLDVIARRQGLKIIETPVGFKHIGQLMLKEPVIIGGEES